MRMRKMKNLLPRLEASGSVLIDNPEEYKGKWRSLMPEAKELRVEVGCGKGKFTAETAAAEPDVLIIALERVREAMVIGMEKVISMGLKNVYFVSVDVANIEDYFAPDEVDLLYINFCDPWPRSKNAKRRLTYHTFLEKYRNILRIGGQIHFKTDNRALFDWSLDEFKEYGFPVQNVTYDLHKDGPVGIMTGYEEKFYALGTPINRCEIVISEKKKTAEEAEHV